MMEIFAIIFDLNLIQLCKYQDHYQDVPMLICLYVVFDYKYKYQSINVSKHVLQLKVSIFSYHYN